MPAVAARRPSSGAPAARLRFTRNRCTSALPERIRATWRRNDGRNPFAAATRSPAAKSSAASKILARPAPVAWRRLRVTDASIVKRAHAIARDTMRSSPLRVGRIGWGAHACCGAALLRGPAERVCRDSDHRGGVRQRYSRPVHPRSREEALQPGTPFALARRPRYAPSSANFSPIKASCRAARPAAVLEVHFAHPVARAASARPLDHLRLRINGHCHAAVFHHIRDEDRRVHRWPTPRRTLRRNGTGDGGLNASPFGQELDRRTSPRTAGCGLAPIRPNARCARGHGTGKGNALHDPPIAQRLSDSCRAASVDGFRVSNTRAPWLKRGHLFHVNAASHGRPV
jgi:hypothetical protein